MTNYTIFMTMEYENAAISYVNRTLNIRQNATTLFFATQNGRVVLGFPWGFLLPFGWVSKGFLGFPRVSGSVLCVSIVILHIKRKVCFCIPRMFLRVSCPFLKLKRRQFERTAAAVDNFPDF